ncbi:MAG: hypothetical protein HY720_00240 [Planctomycetes bacterium]|nr:hypothetical protein [Planctomycetota bacterium]
MTAVRVLGVDGRELGEPSGEGVARGERVRLEVGPRSSGLSRETTVGLADPWGRVLWARVLAPGARVTIEHRFGGEELGGIYRFFVESRGRRTLLPVAYAGGAPPESHYRYSFALDVKEPPGAGVRDLSFLLSFPQAAGIAQELEDLRASEPARIATDLAGNAWLHVDQDFLGTSSRALNFRYDALVRTRSVLWDVAAIRAGGPGPLPERRAGREFLSPEPGIESDAPAVRDLARGLAGERAEEIAGNAFHAVRRVLHYRVQEEERGALAGLVAGEGDCTEQAALLAALLRARGVPARVALGRFANSTRLHAIAEVRIRGVWLPMDVTNRPEPLFGTTSNFLVLFRRNWIAGDRPNSQFSFRCRSARPRAGLAIRDSSRLSRVRGRIRTGEPVPRPAPPGPVRLGLDLSGTRARIEIESGWSAPLPLWLHLSLGKGALRVIRVWPVTILPGARLVRTEEIPELQRLPVGPGDLRAHLVDASGRVLAFSST